MFTAFSIKSFNSSDLVLRVLAERYVEGFKDNRLLKSWGLQREAQNAIYVN